MSVDASSSYPGPHTHALSSCTNGKSHEHDEELDDPEPDVDMCESGQAMHDVRSDDDL